MAYQNKPEHCVNFNNLVMVKFIEATDDDGEKAFINLSLVMSIKEDGERYVLNLYGNKYYVPVGAEGIKELLLRVTS